MRSDGFPFIWGLDPCSLRLLCARAVVARRRASERGASLIPCRWDLRFERVACVPCVALCPGDCCWAGRVGAAVPWGLLLGVSRVRRCAMGIAAGRVAWVAPCLGDCRPGRRLGGAVS